MNEKDDGEDHFISAKDSIIMTKHHYEHFLKEESKLNQKHDCENNNEEDDKETDDPIIINSNHTFGCTTMHTSSTNTPPGDKVLVTQPLEKNGKNHLVSNNQSSRL
jgi:hypothetical protein